MVTRHVPVVVLGGGPVGMLLSSLLSSYGVRHTLVEKRLRPTTHPQAHFMNARTMEVLQAHAPRVFREVRRQMPPPHNWRDFVYCNAVLGREYARADHFSVQETSPGFWHESPTNVVHLPQNRFEHILRDELGAATEGQQQQHAELLWGHEAVHVSVATTAATAADGPVEVRVRPPSAADVLLTCDYLVAADGAHSPTRRSLGIPLAGETALQTLINVHFTCPGLGKLLQRPRPAMLYFVFNASTVAVFVAHDPERDEWVCQVPVFPPFRTLADYSDERVLTTLRQGLGLSAAQQQALPITVLTTNTWTMHAEVAEAFQSPCGRVFLAGDAAHRFPPAGGFGMNTGLQDAHNLAWKLAWAHANPASAKVLLRTYERERRPVATANTALSMRNYQKSAATARALGLDPYLAKAAVRAAAASLGDPETSAATAPWRSAAIAAAVKTGVNAVLDTGLATLAGLDKPAVWDARVALLRRQVATGQSLPLIFPKEDIGFEYPTNGGPSTQQQQPTGLFSSPTKLRPGARVPHCWFVVDGSDAVNGGPPTVVSSVTLPALVHVRPADPVPPLVLLVDADHAAAWRAAAAAARTHLSRVAVVAVVRWAPREDDPDDAPSDHGSAQLKYQDPCYQKPFERDGAAAATPFPEANALTLRDVTARWAEVCAAPARPGPGDPLPAVAVRPDGHVLAVRRGAAPATADEATAELIKMMNYLVDL